jgi:LEA14-like dessication related protein
MHKKWWLIPAAIVTYIIYKKYVLSKTFSVFFKSIDFSSLSLLNPTLNIVVQVNNPTNVTAEIQNIKGDLMLNGQYVGTVVGITPTVLETGSSTLRIPVTLSYAGVAGYIESMKRGGGFTLDFNGTILVDYIILPLVFSYKL